MFAPRYHAVANASRAARAHLLADGPVGTAAARTPTRRRTVTPLVNDSSSSTVQHPIVRVQRRANATHTTTFNQNHSAKMIAVQTRTVYGGPGSSAKGGQFESKVSA